MNEDSVIDDVNSNQSEQSEQVPPSCDLSPAEEPEVVSEASAAGAAVDAMSTPEAPSSEDEAQSEVVQYSEEQIKPLVEALLFAHGEPLASKRIAEIAKVDEKIIDDVLFELMESSRDSSVGVELVRIAEKYQYRTKAPFAAAIRELKAGRPRRLSAAALETLAVIAYRQPVVKSDMEKIRGVDVTPTLKTLIERNFVKIVGHQSTVGQPALYGTTEEFLRIFGLNSLSELPTLRELAELDSDPGEVEEYEDNETTPVAAEVGVN
jgi:segregation and condensation protein B